MGVISQPMMSNFYKQHCENLQSLEQATKTVQRTLREYTSIEEEKNAYVYTKILSYLVNSWIEVRLMKLVYECGAFDDSEKSKIIKGGNLEKKWKTALDIAFCKAFSVNQPKNIKTQTTVPFSAKSQYDALLDIIKVDLLESSSIRNRIAHGQWLHAFTNDMMRINGTLTSKLRKENILMIQCRLAMFKSLAQIIHDLAVSKPTFQRDFDTNYKRIEEQRRNFRNIDYDSYKKNMIHKKEIGLERKRRHFMGLTRQP